MSTAATRVEGTARPIPLSRGWSDRLWGYFSKLTQYGYRGWAVMEWECAIKSPEQGAKEGAPFIASHLINATEKAFDDFADSGTDRDQSEDLGAVAYHSYNNTP